MDIGKIFYESFIASISKLHQGDSNQLVRNQWPKWNELTRDMQLVYERAAVAYDSVR